MNSIKNALILSLMVACVPVTEAAPKARHENKHHHANSETLCKKERDRRFHKQCMRDGWLMVGGILAYPISIALYPFTYRANKRRANRIRKELKKQIKKDKEKSARNNAQSIQS